MAFVAEMTYLKKYHFLYIWQSAPQNVIIIAFIPPPPRHYNTFHKI